MCVHINRIDKWYLLFHSLLHLKAQAHTHTHHIIYALVTWIPMWWNHWLDWLAQESVYEDSMISIIVMVSLHWEGGEDIPQPPKQIDHMICLCESERKPFPTHHLDKSQWKYAITSHRNNTKNEIWPTITVTVANDGLDDKVLVNDLSSNGTAPIPSRNSYTPCVRS